MSNGSFACIMFANCERHPYFKDKAAVHGEDPETFCGWTCGNLDSVVRQIENAGFGFVEDAIPEFRDTLAIMRKI